MDDIVINFTAINVFILYFQEKIKKNKVKVTGYDKSVDIKGIREAFSKYGVQFVYRLAEGCVVTFRDQATAEKVLKQKVEVSI